MTINVPVISFISLEESYMFNSMSIKEGYLLDDWEDLTPYMLRGSCVIWEVPTISDARRICRMPGRYWRDFICINGEVKSAQEIKSAVERRYRETA